jgi:hypothetical protein
MPDWEKLVEDRLAGLSLEAGEKNEVIAELAGHLSETYESLFAAGIAEREAVRRTLSQVTDWKDLQEKIHSARVKIKENTMNTRTTRLWLPGLVTFTLSAVLLVATQKFGPRPLIVHAGESPVIPFYIFWLVSLPLIGATGAYLSYRAGARVSTMLVSSIFPSLVSAASILAVLPFSLLFDRFIAHNIAPMALVTALLGWVVVPGTALVAGGLLAAFILQRQSVSRSTTTG